MIFVKITVLNLSPNSFEVILFKKKIKVGEKVGENLTNNQRFIIKYIKENSKISAKELAKRIGISDRKIEENIKKLKLKLILKRVGSTKGGHWEVLKNG